MDGAKLDQLKQFIEQCKADPSILSDPTLSFLRDYLERYQRSLSLNALISLYVSFIHLYVFFFNYFWRNLGADLPPWGCESEDSNQCFIISLYLLLLLLLLLFIFYDLELF